MVADSHYDVVVWTKTFVPEPADADEPHAPAISPQALRRKAESALHLPNELVRGNIAEWMRCHVGKIHVDFAVTIKDTATDDERAALMKLPGGFTTVATDATTKIYKGISQWTPAADVPTGVAQIIYESLHAAYAFEGSVELTDDECAAIGYLGKACNLIGTADPALATMRGIINSVDLEIDTGSTTLGFGPPPHLAPADWLELQRQLRSRPVHWMSQEERGSNKLGAASHPGSKGDTVTPYDVPESVDDMLPVPVASGPWAAIRTNSAGCKITNARLYSTPNSDLVTVHGLDDEITLAATTKIWLQVAIHTDLTIKPDPGAVVTSGTTLPADNVTFDTATPPKQTQAVVPLGAVVAGKLPAGTLGFDFVISGSPYYFRQDCTTTLCMQAMPVSGKAAAYPLPFNG